VILLDTHIWVRWLLPGDPLPPTLLAAIESAEPVGVSAVSCWEVVLLVQRNRIEFDMPVTEWLSEATSGSGVMVEPIDCGIAHRAGSLPEHHKDPADRLIIATALERNTRLASLDSVFSLYTELQGRLLPITR
jgi:PIN domain nuclease of toxin-antitoxin system